MESIRTYLKDHAAIERDALYCSIDDRSRVLIHEAADELAVVPALVDDLVKIDEALPGDHATWNAAPWRRPAPSKTNGESFLLVFPVLHHVEPIRAFYAGRKIPETYLRAALSDLERWIETHRERTGTPGFSEISWLREHLCARIFEIGRLQFQPGTWELPVTALVHKKTGERVLLANAENEIITTAGGFGSAAGADPEGAIPLLYEESAAGFAGHRLTAAGKIARAAERFPAEEWSRLVSIGEPVINIHIPCGSPLAPEACRSSIREALRFFPTYFPDWPIAKARAFVCVSWLLCPDFPEILPPGSNILGFQKLFRPFPVPGMGDYQFYERAFVPWGRAVTRDKLTTRLQFALYDHIQAGNTPLEGGGVLFTDEVPASGGGR